MFNHIRENEYSLEAGTDMYGAGTMSHFDSLRKKSSAEQGQKTFFFYSYSEWFHSIQ